jgi:hypothetical protein
MVPMNTARKLQHRNPSTQLIAVMFGLLCIGANGQAAELLQLGKANPLARDEFGYAMASDGQRIAIAAPGENAEAGAVYIFDCASPGCPQEARIAATDLASGNAFGSALAFSGNTLAIGAPAQAAGATYIFIRSAPGAWIQQAKLTDSGGMNGERFGSALALLGDTLLVGADGDSSGRGAVFAFNRTGSTWALPSLLLAADGVAGDAFGSAVALSSGHALIGAPFEGNSGAGQMHARGAAYAFERLSPTTWSGAPIKLLAAVPASNALFGYAVALQGGRAVVGAPFASAETGRAAIFDFTTGVGWSATAELGSAFAQPGARLGWSLALDGELLTVGAPFDAFDPGANCGLNLRYSRVASVWGELAPLRLRDALPGSLSGWTSFSSGQRHAAALPGFARAARQHSGQVAWFDDAELVFAEAYESPDPSCVDIP